MYRQFDINVYKPVRDTFIDKVYDVRVTVIGNDMYAVRIDSQKFKEMPQDLNSEKNVKKFKLYLKNV